MNSSRLVLNEEEYLFIVHGEGKPILECLHIKPLKTLHGAVLKHDLDGVADVVNMLPDRDKALEKKDLEI